MQRTSNSLSPTTQERKLNAILQRDEHRSIIYSIREELFDRAWKQCYEKYLKRQTVRFVVDCAHEALTEIVNLNFYAHDEGSPYYVGHPSWLPNKPPEPSTPDSWATCKVPVSKTTARELTAAASKDDNIKLKVFEDCSDLCDCKQVICLHKRVKSNLSLELEPDSSTGVGSTTDSELQLVTEAIPGSEDPSVFPNFQSNMNSFNK